MKRFASMLAACLLAALSFNAYAAAPVCVAGLKGAAPTANIVFTAPTLGADGLTVAGPITYNVYQSTASGTEVKVASALAGSPIVVATGLTSAVTFYWYVTAVNAGGESAPSNEVCKIFPASPPGSVTITVS